MAVIHLIRRMSTENVMWGAPKIASELALLGHVVADSTVARYMVKIREPNPVVSTYPAASLQPVKTGIRGRVGRIVGHDGVADRRHLIRL